MTALQMMILQSDGQELRVLPAWPSNWDVQFKLHAPMGTVVQGEFAGGKLIYVRTEPPERAKDIVP
jgi:hypothetical protein